MVLLCLLTVGRIGALCEAPHVAPICRAHRPAALLTASHRRAAQDVPTSYAYELEAATIVQPEKVAEAVRKVCGARVAA